MESFLSKIFKKNGIDNATELNSDELAQVSIWEAEWKTILAKPDITIDDVRLFCDNQIKLIEWQWRNLDNPDKKNERLILLHTVWSLLRGFLNSKDDSRQAFEKYLESLSR